MKKIHLFATCVLLLVLSASIPAQAKSVEGKNFGNAHIGISGFSGTGRPPVTAPFEHGFTSKINWVSCHGPVSFHSKHRWIGGGRLGHLPVATRRKLHILTALFQ